MKRVFKNYKNDCLLKVSLLITLSIIMTIAYSNTYLVNSKELDNTHINYKTIICTQDTANDTTAPIIKFLQPSSNNSIISKQVYTIIVNISDNNPPSYGNVTIQLSNATSFIFNATMDYDGGNQWIFDWDNISSYQNQLIYIFQVWAKDSSPNENYGRSEEIYIFLKIRSTPAILNMIIYLLIVGFIFAAITVYLNKKGIHK